MFASDGVTPIGGVSAVGTGRSFAPSSRDIEAPRGPLQSKGIQPGSGHRPMLQMGVETHPMPDVGQRAPGIGTMFGKAVQVAFDFLRSPQPTRGGNIATKEEQETFLAGQPGKPPDDEARGLMFEPVSSMGTSEPGQEGAKEITDAWDAGPAPILNIPVGGLTDDMSTLVQDFPTNERETLSAFHTSFPYVGVKQAPAAARNIVLQQIGGAGPFVGELNLPDNAVTARIAWTAGVPGVSVNDLWMSLSSQAFIPSAAGQAGTSGGITQAGTANDGAILNPDTSKDYLVKGKRAMSFACSNACIVSVQIYSQA